MEVDLINIDVSLNQEQTARLKAIFKQKTLENGEYFIQAGDRSTQIGFVMSGLFRSFILDEKGIDVTKYFYPEGAALFSYAAHLTGEPSAYYIQALENSKLLVANINDFEKIIKDDFQLGLIFKGILDRNLIMKDHHASSFVLFDSIERYQQFLENYPGLEKRVKQYHLASFLGITPVSLSRIRKKIGLIK